PRTPALFYCKQQIGRIKQVPNSRPSSGPSTSYNPVPSTHEAVKKTDTKKLLLLSKPSDDSLQHLAAKKKAVRAHLLSVSQARFSCPTCTNQQPVQLQPQELKRRDSHSSTPYHPPSLRRLRDVTTHFSTNLARNTPFHACCPR
ncbi:unnamed protein product, partial [Ectocarpus sp. 8 AP-2014]